MILLFFLLLFLNLLSQQVVMSFFVLLDHSIHHPLLSFPLQPIRIYWPLKHDLQKAQTSNPLPDSLIQNRFLALLFPNLICFSPVLHLIQNSFSLWPECHLIPPITIYMSPISPHIYWFYQLRTLTSQVIRVTDLVQEGSLILTSSDRLLASHQYPNQFRLFLILLFYIY